MANQNDTQGWCHFDTNKPELTLLPEITFAGNFFHFCHIYIFVCKLKLMSAEPTLTT